MIRANAYNDYLIWEHSKSVHDLYKKRCRKDVEEMTCAKQAIELLRPYLANGDLVLDAGCGSGYLYHSFKDRGLEVNYYGIDASKTLISIGKEELPRFGLDPEHLINMRFEDLRCEVDHVICMNVLSNIDNYHKALERFLQGAKKTVILRESISDNASYQYVKDKYLDNDVDLKVHVNTYKKEDISSFIKSYGFTVEFVNDERTQGQPEDVIDYPHHWTFVRAVRN